jgi:probable rRNA maturation factor
MAAAGIHVEVEDASGMLGVPAAPEFARWAVTALATSVREGELSIRIVGETEGAALNEQYRRKQGATNVLSFPAQLPHGVPVDAFGDLVICAPVVAREAAEQGKPLGAHWAHMVVHGCLHLLGFDHELEVGAAAMESLETSILAQLGYPDPYAPR